MRLFVAQEVDATPFLGCLEDIRGAVTTRAKWVDPTKLHITYQFLGEVAPSKLGDIQTALDSLEGFGPFEITLQGLGVFPNERRPRVLWIGAHASKLPPFARIVQLRLKECGFAPDKKFSSHITIARLKEQSGMGGLIEKYRDHVFSRFTASRLMLKESILMSDGPVYNMLYEVNL